MIYPMKLKPATKDYVWGGTRLKREWKKPSEGDVIAESWELSCHNDGMSVIENGEYAGMPLGELLEHMPLYKGEKCGQFEFFPILIKLIDAKTNLSIQVHPSDEYALAKEGQYGKSEMWYIVDAEEGSGVYCGFKKAVDATELEEALKGGKILDLLNFIPVKKGDSIYIPSGTVHAICGGLLICEVQQNSSLTYRLYDYDRVGKDGKKRELHIEKALQVVNTAAVTSPNENVVCESDGVRRLASCKYFTVREIKVDPEYKGAVGQECFLSLTCTEGEGVLIWQDTSFDVALGDTIFLPAGLGEFTLRGGMTVISACV